MVNGEFLESVWFNLLLRQGFLKCRLSCGDNLFSTFTGLVSKQGLDEIQSSVMITISISSFLFAFCIKSSVFPHNLPRSLLVAC